jgi:uncharacterized protein (DUF305 family)
MTPARPSIPRLRTVLVALAVVLIATLAASAVTAEARKGPSHNRTDDVFSQKMRKHHLHGIAMAQLAVVKASDRRVAALARQIAAVQTAEAVEMRGFLRRSGASLNGPPVPPIRAAENAQQLAELRSAQGVAFDRRFLQLMQGHHFGGVDMAEIEIRGGLKPPARRLAVRIRATQLREAAQMESLLNQI